MPMVSAPPGRFSTTTVWPSAFVSSGARMRATVSVALPGAWGTMKRIGRSGYCAAAPAAAKARQAASSLAERTKDFLHDVAAGPHRVLADFLLFLGNHVEQAVERLLRHVLIEVGLLFLDEAELGALLGILVVFFG